LKRKNIARAAYLIAAWLTAGNVAAQQVQLDRLPQDELDVLSPAARVVGVPGEMQFVNRSCQASSTEHLRHRLVDIVVQEWAFFGFTVLDQTNLPEVEPPRSGEPRRRRTRLDPAESARVAQSIAGYWAATPDGRWILERQNEVWNGPNGVAARWRDPWSAAFISWVMCEAGLGETQRFQRAIAHHSYIDQAIVARDTDNSGAAGPAFAAFDVGERIIEPGDMLCVARRPNYRNLADRRSQFGEGVRSHCDIVVKVDAENERILAIGGNVRSSVRLKMHAAEFEDDNVTVSRVGRGQRTVFAHLKLAANSIDTDVIRNNPTLRSLAADADAAAALHEQLTLLLP